MNSVFLPFQALQALAQYVLYRRCARHTRYALSADLAVFSCIWLVCHTLSTALYAYSPTVHSEYALRYPLYPEIAVLSVLPLVHLVQALISAVNLRVFWDAKRTERTSLLCGVVVLVYGLCLIYMSWLYGKGRARVNLLDLADLLHLIGTISWAVRLVPQLSVDWFQERVPHLSTYVYLQIVSILYALICNVMLDRKWYDFPVDAPPNASLLLVAICCCGVVYQTHKYKPLLPNQEAKVGK